MDYQEYLKSEHWQAFRLTVLDFWNGQCGLCVTQAKDVHHRIYDNLGEENLTDCLPLCRSCHIKFHKTLREVAQLALSRAIDLVNSLRLQRNDEFELAQGTNWDRYDSILREIDKAEHIRDLIDTALYPGKNHDLEGLGLI